MTVAAERHELAGPTREESAAAPPAARTGPAVPRRRRSSLTRRILTLNLLALAIPVAGLLYLGEYRNSLVQQQLELMSTEAELFSGALAASGVVTGPAGDERLLPETTRSTTRLNSSHVSISYAV